MSYEALWRWKWIDRVFCHGNKFTGMIPVAQDNKRLSASFSSVLMMALLI